MAKKTIQVPADDMLLGWVNKSMKEMKIKTQAEFVRTVLTYVKDTDIAELKTKMEKTRITAMLQEAQNKAHEALERKEALEAQLLKLEA